MEKKYMRIIPFATCNDEVLNFSYILCITTSGFETIKLPAHISKLPYNHLLSGIYAINCELTKTRKNWILKEIQKSEQILTPSTYSDYVKIEAIRAIILTYYQPNHKNDILEFILCYFEDHSIANISKIEFKTKLDIFFGFKTGS